MMIPTKKILTMLLFGAMVLTLLSFDLPKGWLVAGSSPDRYEMGIDKGAGQSGRNAATIKSISQASFDLINEKASDSYDESINGFGTLMQKCKVGKYAGKKIKMSGNVKSTNVVGWAGLWLRVDQAGAKQSLAFDNMYDRAIKGTTSWKKYEIVLNVPSNASVLAYGALLSGAGQIWFENITFEVVGNAEKTTGATNAGNESYVQEEPANLDFAK